MAWIEDMMPKMLRRFDTTYENVEDMRSDLSSLRQNMVAYAFSIKHIELQMT